MRAGRGGGFIKDESGALLGVNLGADYCAEHEWGIDNIAEAFGFTQSTEKPFRPSSALIGKPKPLFGIKKRLIHTLPENIALSKFKIGNRNVKFLVFGYNDWSGVPSDKKSLRPEMQYLPKDGFKAGWSDGDFGILVDKQHFEEIDELWAAFLRNDIIVGLFGGGPFKNAGLKFIIASRFPKELAEGMRKADEDRYNLLVAAEKTGIQERLLKAGKKWFALSPKWTTDGWDDIAKRTKYDVVFFLNPEDQQNCYWGWVTVEDLLDWIDDKGNIPNHGRLQQKR
jgi:hypothetical protein